MTNIATNVIACSIGVVNWMLPRQRVPSQLNVLMADGTAISIVLMANVVPSDGFMPALEHVVGPDDEPEEGDRRPSRRSSGGTRRSACG